MNPLPTQGLVLQQDVDRFIARVGCLSVTTQDTFMELFNIYSKGNVEYDVNMSYSTFNLRYPSHPQTNLSEAIAFDYVLSQYPDFEVELVTSKDEQMLGYDIRAVKHDGFQHPIEYTFSVKMASIPDDKEMRSFSIHKSVKQAIKNDKSKFVVFVDIITNQLVFSATDLAQDALCGCFTTIAKPDRIMVFYDLLGLIGPIRLTQC